jgi:ribonucleotide reductase beta subunit family protein with ferritin-like domain
MSNIFEKRDSIQPYEYADLIRYANAIHESFWTPEHFTYDRDINDFIVKLNDVEKDVVKKAMLSIGVIENKVKTFWARIDMRMPKTEIAIVGHTFAGNECHIEGTEVLTPEGWKDFKDVKNGDLVYQYNINNSLITSTSISNIIKKPFNGEMIRYNNQRMDAIVTPNHRIIYKTEQGNIKEVLAKDFNFNSNILFPKSGVLSNEGINSLSDLDRLRIAIQADGTRLYYINRQGEKKFRGIDDGYTYSLTFKKKVKKDRLRSLLNNLSISYIEENPKRVDYTTFKIRLKDSFDLKTFDWVDLKDKSPIWCKEFINEVLLWDGYIKENKKLYISTNKGCIDKTQVIAILAGYRTHVSVSEDNRKNTYKTRYTLSFKDKPFFESSTLKQKKFQYEGIVYCGSVETGILITRYNNKVFISGNCIHQLTYEKLLSLLGLEKEFENVVNIPCMQGRSEYLGKYLQGVYSKSNKEFTKSLILFTLLVENTSLFSQFLIVSAFKKHKNVMSNFNSVISATAREENLHAKFGEELINIIRNENPDWFDTDMENKIRRNVRKALEAEIGVLNWIFEKGELEFLSKKNIIEYLKSRFNKSLNQIGYKNEFEIEESLLKPTEFLEVQLTATSSFDFFNEKSTDYSQNTAFNEEEIWD